MSSERTTSTELLERVRGLCPRPGAEPEISFAREGWGVVRVLDAGTQLTYRLTRTRTRRGARERGMYGWVEGVRLAGETRIGWRAVGASEPYAVLRQFGREGEVFELTAQFCRILTHGGRLERSAAERIVRSLHQGVELERVGLRALQVAILERLEEGVTLAELCERGGFVTREGRPDTTWYQRRAGLMRHSHGASRKMLYARTAEYEMAVALCRSVEREPWEMGL